MQEVKLFPCTINMVSKLREWGDKPHLAEFFRQFPPYFEWVNDPKFLENVQHNSLEISVGNELCGLVYINIFSPAARSVQVGLIIDHPKHSEIASEVYTQIQDYVFKQKGFNRIEVKILSHRTKLKERLEAIGFKVEGTLRQSCRFNGEFADELILGLLWKS